MRWIHAVQLAGTSRPQYVYPLPTPSPSPPLKGEGAGGLICGNYRRSQSTPPIFPRARISACVPERA
jgi:hypothetical protein